MRSGPCGLHLATDGSHCDGHRITTGEPCHLGRHGERRPLQHRSIGAGALCPFGPDGETEQRRLKPPERSSRESDQTAMPASTSADSSSTDEPKREERRCMATKEQAPAGEAKKRFDAKTFPLTATAGREGTATPALPHHHSLLPPRPSKSGRVAEEPSSPELAPMALIGDVCPLQGRRRAPNRGACREPAREASRCYAGAPLGTRPATRSSILAGEPPLLATVAGRRGTRAATGAARRADLI
jgi:hypothetical protein